MKKMTKAQKIQMNKSSGQSRYALKVERRRKLAARLGSSDLPLPILNLEDTTPLPSASPHLQEQQIGGEEWE